MAEETVEIKGVEIELQSLTNVAGDLSKIDVRKLEDKDLKELVINARKYLNSLFVTRIEEIGYYE